MALQGRPKNATPTQIPLKRDAGTPNLKQYPLRQEAQKGIQPILEKFLKTGLIKPCRSSSRSAGFPSTVVLSASAAPLRFTGLSCGKLSELAPGNMFKILHFLLGFGLINFSEPLSSPKTPKFWLAWKCKQALQKALRWVTARVCSWPRVPGTQVRSINSGSDTCSSHSCSLSPHVFCSPSCPIYNMRTFLEHFSYCKSPCE